MFGVEYVILGKKYFAGLYDTWEEAEDHRRDIAGYEGVSDAMVYTIAPKEGNN